MGTGKDPHCVAFSPDGKILAVGYEKIIRLCNVEKYLAPKPVKKQEDLVAFKEGSKWGFKNKGGKIVIKPTFEGARIFSEGLAAVKVGGKWGYIDTSGKFVIQPGFDGASPFKNCRARVSIGEKVGTIDRNGNKVSPFTVPRKRIDF